MGSASSKRFLIIESLLFSVAKDKLPKLLGKPRSAAFQYRPGS
jgi:hypothetical protein